MDETIDAIVEASYFLINVIIIGIGYSDFGNMIFQMLMKILYLIKMEEKLIEI